MFSIRPAVVEFKIFKSFWTRRIYGHKLRVYIYKTYQVYDAFKLCIKIYDEIISNQLPIYLNIMIVKLF